MRSVDIDSIAALLAHEMKHVQQYRILTTDRFKCDYARHMVECGMCQDRRHPMEREAYEFQDAIKARLDNTPQRVLIPDFPSRPGRTR